MAPTYETPRRGGAERGFGVGIEAAKLDNPEDTKYLPHVQPFVHLGDAAHMALAATWWRLRTDGVWLLAERGVIILNGGRR
jgi:hypothetical protein